MLGFTIIKSVIITTENFAPKGNSVSDIPPGTGVMILAAHDVEVFENEIFDNKTVGTSIVSYYIT